MNGSCAGGTGAFIDQMATLLNVTTEELDELPFIRSSSPPLKKMIFASSPPSSMTASVSGSYSITVL